MNKYCPKCQDNGLNVVMKETPEGFVCPFCTALTDGKGEADEVDTCTEYGKVKAEENKLESEIL